MKIINHLMEIQSFLGKMQIGPQVIKKKKIEYLKELI